MRSNLPLPKRIENAPELWPGLELFMNAFLELESCRQGMPGLIPWTAVQHYAETYEFSTDQAAALHHHIPVMDNLAVSLSKKKSSNGKSN